MRRSFRARYVDRSSSHAITWQGGHHGRRGRRFDAAPFFWSQHYDLAINYVGHAENWDAVEIDGSLDASDCAVTYKRGSRTLAVATIYRDLQSLRAELAMETAPAGLERQ